MYIYRTIQIEIICLQLQFCANGIWQSINSIRGSDQTDVIGKKYALKKGAKMLILTFYHEMP